MTLVALLAVAVTVAASGSTIRVPDDELTIQEGLDAANAGDTVVVAFGSYYEHDILMKSGVLLTSESGAPECVTIDGQGLGRVLYCNEVSEGTVISGFTITGGWAVEAEGNQGADSPDSTVIGEDGGERPWWEPYCGAGISCRSSRVRLEHLVFTGNEADRGGGLALPWESSVELVDVSFDGNVGGKYGGGVFSDFDSDMELDGVTFTGNSTRHYGGGMYCRKGHITFADAVFDGNSSGEQGGGLMIQNDPPGTQYSFQVSDCAFRNNTCDKRGAGLFFFRACNTVLANSTVEDNAAYWSGGGIYVRESSPLISNCLFAGNTAGDSAGLHLFDWAPTVEWCTFVGNHAESLGGAVGCGGYSDFSNCTFVGNSAGTDGAIVATDYSSRASFFNCILAFSHEAPTVWCDSDQENVVLECSNVFGNEAGDWVDCIRDQVGINGNMTLDPLFCGDAGSEHPYSLHANSPCAPDNSGACGLVGAWEVECDATSVEQHSWGGIKALYR